MTLVRITKDIQPDNPVYLKGIRHQRLIFCQVLMIFSTGYHLHVRPMCSCVN